MRAFPSPAVLAALAMMFAASVNPVPAHAGKIQDLVPVLSRAPACKAQRLGVVTIGVGRRVNGRSQEALVPSADYVKAFQLLSERADEKGGNAVVLRGHNATYFNRNRRRSRQPVHIELRGAVIRIDDDRSTCPLAVIDPNEVRRRARAGEPVDLLPRQGD